MDDIVPAAARLGSPQQIQHGPKSMQFHALTYADIASETNLKLANDYSTTSLMLRYTTI